MAEDEDASDAVLRTIEFFRKECQFEMNLIGTRITWLLAAQAFLVTASVFALANALNCNVRSGWVLSTLASAISSVGAVISIKTIKAVDSARYTLDIWHERMTQLSQSLDGNEHTAWVALILGRWSKPDDDVHKESLKLSAALPVMFACFWSLVFVVSVALTIWLALGSVPKQR